jgi:stage II sporulation protein P
MKDRHRSSRVKAARILTVPLLIFFSYLCIRLGIYAGNYIFSINKNFAENIDTESFRTTLNYSIPLISTVYNSGNVNVSVIEEVKSISGRVLGFSINAPLTILNVQSPYFRSYYNKHYLPLITAQREREVRELGEDEVKISTADKSGTQAGDNGSGIREEKSGEPAENAPKDNITGYLEDASSVEYQEDEDKAPDPDVVSSGKIEIHNESKLKISEADIAKLLKDPLKLKFEKKGPKVLIYHTHTTEAYLKKLEDLKKKNVPSRTQDPRYSVAKVGDELTNYLKKYEISTIHNNTIHDYNYPKSYVNSLNTLQKYLKSYTSLKMTIDLHRDAKGSGEDKLRVPAKINGKNAAQIMFVIGTNKNNYHPNWKENLKLALKLQEKMNELYPGLSKPVWISHNRYNQHMTTGSITVEIGGDGNTIDEALESARYLAKVISEVIN